MLTILLILFVLIAFGGLGWGWYGGPNYVGPLGAVLLLVILLLLIFGGMGPLPHWR